MNCQHTNAKQNENPESMKLSEPEPDKLTAESVENSYATHDGKNKCLIADLQSNSGARRPKAAKWSPIPI